MAILTLLFLFSILCNAHAVSGSKSTLSSNKEQRHQSLGIANAAYVQESNITNNAPLPKPDADAPQRAEGTSITDVVALVTALAALASVAVTLFLNLWLPWHRRPKLRVHFDTSKNYPYFHTLSLGSYPQAIDFAGQVVDIVVPGFNLRTKISNDGKTTARKVQARIEKIVFTLEAGRDTRYYHPTTVKWSGELSYDPVDIVPGSHFFLDVFRARNETTNEVLAFNMKRLRDAGVMLEERILKRHIATYIEPSESIYWEVWVESPEVRGIQSRYNFEGIFTIHFVLNAENCKPVQFQAQITWRKATWNNPEVRIIS